MNTHPLRHWLRLGAIGITPFLGVAAVRHFTGVSGPAAAHAASDDDLFQDDTANPEALVEIIAREAVVAANTLSQPDSPWTGPLFTPIAEPESDPDTPAPVVAQPAPAESRHPSPVRPGQYADRFVLTSLMAGRDGAIAVIDRKLHRVGDTVSPGVFVESIDLESRVVMLRTSEGHQLERRPNR